MALDKAKLVEEILYLRKEVKRLRKALSKRALGIYSLLQHRGFKVYKKEPNENLLIPTKKYLKTYYQMLHKYSFRLFLRDVIKHQHLLTLDRLIRFATPSVTREYFDFLLEVKLLKKNQKKYSLVSESVTSFGETLEWYIAEIFKREFCCDAAWGIKFKRAGIGGDYDIIAAYQGTLVYVEVKSSPPKQIYDSEIAAFFDRINDLAPEIAIFLMDTELRMKDKIVPMFEKELTNRYFTHFHVLRVEREIFRVRNNIFIMNAKDGIIKNIERVIYWHLKRAF